MKGPQERSFEMFISLFENVHFFGCVEFKRLCTKKKYTKNKHCFVYFDNNYKIPESAKNIQCKQAAPNYLPYIGI